MFTLMGALQVHIGMS